uniref:Uncharacterized protein n=1 Tax=Anguilla anguilla TaxID=7936 RepID=A0A0E9RSQ8_ANGAN
MSHPENGGFATAVMPRCHAISNAISHSFNKHRSAISSANDQVNLQ